MQIFYFVIIKLNVLFTWTVLAHDEVHRLKTNLSEWGLEVWSIVQNDVVIFSQVCVDGWNPVVQRCKVFIKKELQKVFKDG